MSPPEVRTKARPSTSRYGGPATTLSPRVPSSPPRGPKKASSSLSLPKTVEKPSRAPTKRREAPMALRREVGCVLREGEREKRGRKRRGGRVSASKKRKRSDAGQSAILLLSLSLSLSLWIQINRSMDLTMFATKRGSGGGGGGGGSS
jgi:hypothetical protein